MTALFFGCGASPLLESDAVAGRQLRNPLRVRLGWRSHSTPCATIRWHPVRPSLVPTARAFPRRLFLQGLCDRRRDLRLPRTLPIRVLWVFAFWSSISLARTDFVFLNRRCSFALEKQVIFSRLFPGPPPAPAPKGSQVFN